MYSFFAKLWKLFVYIFRVFQVLGIVYFLLFVLVWFFAVAQSPVADTFWGLYKFPYDVTINIFKSFGYRFSSEYSLLRLDILASIFFTFIALLLYNFLFIPMGAIERFFIEKSYAKGEQGTPEI